MRGAGDGITVLLTVLNDVDDLRGTLAALDSQETAASEVLVVDGGSTDGTRELLEEWTGARAGARLLTAPGTNISAGRNVGVGAANGPWIACTDAGCRPDPGWLGAFSEARPDHDFLAGVWIVDGRSAFERCVGIAGHPDPAELVEPSLLTRVSHALFGRRFTSQGATGRSMAFTKRTWERAGGFPEGLYAGEDVAFSLAAHDAGARAALVPSAVVRWRPRPGWWTTARTYASYARGDIRTPPRRAHAIRTGGLALGIAAVTLLGIPGLLLALVGLAVYLALPLARAFRTPEIWPRYVWLVPPVVVLKDLANLVGAGLGLLDAARGRAQPRPPEREAAAGP